jgi:hypothetical protein
LLPSASQLAASKKPQKPKHRSPLLPLLPLPLLLLQPPLLLLSLLRTLLLPPLALLLPLLPLLPLAPLLLLLPLHLLPLHLLPLHLLLLQPLLLLLQPSLQKHRRSNFSVLASQKRQSSDWRFFSSAISRPGKSARMLRVVEPLCGLQASPRKSGILVGHAHPLRFTTQHIGKGALCQCGRVVLL